MISGGLGDTEGVSDESNVFGNDLLTRTVEEIFLEVINEVTLDECLDAKHHDVINVLDGALARGPGAVDHGRR